MITIGFPLVRSAMQYIVPPERSVSIWGHWLVGCNSDGWAPVIDQAGHHEPSGVAQMLRSGRRPSSTYWAIGWMPPSRYHCSSAPK